MTHSKAEMLARHFIEKREDPTKSSPSLIAQIEHRLQLVSFWDIQPGSRVLELGCGQGDTTIVLADAVGPEGHIDAIDPGAADYGSPFTLLQAQQHILDSSLGPRIAFYLTTAPTTFLSDPNLVPYDYIVLSHCIYYFSSPSILPSLLSGLTPHTTTLCLAEWSLSSSSRENTPHLLTALLWTLLESKQKVESRRNVRTVLSPAQIKKCVENEGWVVDREGLSEVGKGMKDAYWEVRDVLGSRERELGALEELGLKERTLLEAMWDAVEASLVGVEGGVEGVSCMDAWMGVFLKG